MPLSCPICFNTQPKSNFRIFSCGHGFCVTCIESILHRNPFCPQCRKKINRREGYSIYMDWPGDLDIPKTQEEQGVAFVKLLNDLMQLDQNSKCITIQLTQKRLRRSSKMFEGSEGIVDILTEMSKDFNRRIIPMFKRADEQHAQIEQLKGTRDEQQLQVAASKQRVESLELEVTELRKSLHDMEEQCNHAINLANVASTETVQLRKDLEISRGKILGLEEQNHRYKGQLLGHAKAARKREEEIESLACNLAHMPTQHTESTTSYRESESVAAIQDRSRSHELKSTVHLNLPSSDKTNRSNKQYDYEGMSSPISFRSDWQLPDRGKTIKKRKLSSENRPTNLPLKFDHKGRLIGVVHTGIKRTLRAPLRQVRS